VLLSGSEVEPAPGAGVWPVVVAYWWHSPKNACMERPRADVARTAGNGVTKRACRRVPHRRESRGRDSAIRLATAIPLALAPYWRLPATILAVSPRRRRVAIDGGISSSAATPRLVRWTVRHARSVFAPGSSTVRAFRSTWRHSSASASAGRAPESAMNRTSGAHRPHSSATRSTSATLNGRMRSPRTGVGAYTFKAGFSAKASSQPRTCTSSLGF
jgi:hypothetical protein